MTRFRLLAAAVAGLSGFLLLFLAGQARTQSAASENILPVLSTSDVIGYTSPCG